MPRSIVVNQTPCARHVEDDDVRERPDEHRVARLQHVVGLLVELVERGRVGAARLAAERLRLLGVEHVEDEVRVGDVVHEREPVGLEGVADRLRTHASCAGDVACPRSRTCACGNCTAGSRRLLGAERVRRSHPEPPPAPGAPSIWVDE